VQKDSLADFPEEIPRLCEQAGLTEEELADRAGIDLKTLRKIRGRHQSTSRVVVQSLRNAARLAVLEKNAGSFPEYVLREGEAPYNAELISPAMKFWQDAGTDKVEENLQYGVGMLAKVPASDRELVLLNILAFVQELLKRERKPIAPKPAKIQMSGSFAVSSKVTSSAKDMADVAHGAVDPDPSSSPKPGAGAPNVQKDKPSDGAAPPTKKQP
jgi:transcriptional regulator with XRE-family HTH domain